MFSQLVLHKRRPIWSIFGMIMKVSDPVTVSLAAPRISHSLTQDRTRATAVNGWLTLILLKWRIWLAPNSASRWQMGFNSAFKRVN